MEKLQDEVFEHERNYDYDYDQGRSWTYEQEAFESQLIQESQLPLADIQLALEQHQRAQQLDIGHLKGVQRLKILNAIYLIDAYLLGDLRYLPCADLTLVNAQLLDNDKSYLEVMRITLRGIEKLRVKERAVTSVGKYEEIQSLRQKIKLLGCLILESIFRNETPSRTQDQHMADASDTWELLDNREESNVRYSLACLFIQKKPDVLELFRHVINEEHSLCSAAVIVGNLNQVVDPGPIISPVQLEDHIDYETEMEMEQFLLNLTDAEKEAYNLGNQSWIMGPKKCDPINSDNLFSEPQNQESVPTLGTFDTRVQASPHQTTVNTKQSQQTGQSQLTFGIPKTKNTSDNPMDFSSPHQHRPSQTGQFPTSITQRVQQPFAPLVKQGDIGALQDLQQPQRSNADKFD